MIEIFKSKERRQAEKKAEMVEFFRSSEGRRVIFELAPDILVSSKLAPILNDVRVQLESLTAGEVERFRLSLETTFRTTERHFTNEIDRLERHLETILRRAEGSFC